MLRSSKWKYGVGAALVLLAVAAWSPARAGNLDLPLPDCLYYSVTLRPGEAFRYTGTAGEYTLTVDDVTYTVAIDPCDTYERCVFFTEDEITAFADETANSGSTFTPPSTGPGFAGGIATSTMSSSNTYFNQVLAKGAYLRLELYEGTLGGASGATFDAVSHTLYGLYTDKFKSAYQRSETVTEWGTFDQHNGPMTAVATATGAMSEAVGLSTWAVQTSESRHYQSPQIVQRGIDNSNWVGLSNTTAFSDYGTYQEAMVMIKGRVWEGTEGAPVETFDIEVGQP